jgi:hypothetical protein
VTVTDWFGVKISPEVTPLLLYPVPVTVTPEIVTFEFPLLVSVVVNELLLPTLTLPKLKLDELNPSTRVAATPVPLREIVVGELGALLTNVIDPVTLPAALGPNTALNVVAFPAPMVTGAVIPVVLKPAPVTVTDEIVTVALPPFVRLMVCELFVPVVTLPKAAAVGVADNCGWVPVPLREIVSGELGALLTTVIVPVTLPAALGPNTALNVVAFPAPMVTGAAIPVVLKPAPEAVTEEIVTVAPPPFVRLMVCELLVPVATLPNAAVVGEADNCGWVPVPLREIVSGELGALLTTVIVPVTVPAALGPNTALNVADLPAATVTGAVIPVVLKPAPVTVTDEIVTVAPPPFVRLMVCELFVPVATLPNAAVVGEAANCGCVPVPLKGIVSGEFCPLLAIEMVPLAIPAVVGAN